MEDGRQDELPAGEGRRSNVRVTAVTLKAQTDKSTQISASLRSIKLS